MKISLPFKGVMHAEFDKRIELTLTMARIQEFYESPHPEIRGRVFSWEKFIACYSTPEGDLDYFSYWDGFNVPPLAVKDFMYRFILTDRERALLYAWEREDMPYLIATCASSNSTTVAHELAHARWFTDPVYKRDGMRVLNSMSNELADRMRKDLIGRYVDDIELLADEVHAYLLTGDEKELSELMPNVKPEERLPFQERLKEALA